MKKGRILEVFMKKGIILLLLMLVPMFLFAGGQAESAGAAKEKEPIRIGVVGPMTGSAAMNGQFMRQAVDLATEEVNASGGVLGRSVKIYYEDDQATPNLALNAVNKQIFGNKVDALIGPHHSSNVLAVEKLVQENKVVLLSGATSPKIKEVNNPWVFRIRASDTLSAKMAVTYAIETLKAKKIGMLHINDDFGTGALSVVKDAMEKRGMELTSVDGFNVGDKDMSGQLLKMKRAGVEALICWSHDAEGGIIARQYKELGLDSQMKMIGSATFSLSQWLSIVSAEVADGIRSVNDFVPSNPLPVVQEFNKKYMEKYNMTTDLYSAAYYDAANILFNAINQAGSLDPDAIRTSLAGMKSYSGVMAEYSFDDYRDGVHQILVVENKGLTPEVVTTVKE